MTPLLVKFSDGCVQGLRIRSQQDGVTVSQIVREAVQNFLSGRMTCEIVTSGIIVCSGSVLTVIK